MKKINLVVLALATALATAPAAMATTQTFYFNFTGAATGSGTPGVGLTSGSGYLYGTLVGTNEYEITGGTGIVIDGQAATVLLDNATPSFGGVDYGVDTVDSPGFNYDNLIFTTTPGFVDTTGLVFNITSTPDQLELFLQGSTVLSEEYNSSTGLDTPIYVSGNPATNGYDTTFGVSPASATPEPSSLLLMGTGLLLMAGFLFWRKAQQDVL
ncbi:MAG: PEP-CTERM sorting domain-containing protein [Terracidiphilus sp.]